MNLTLERIILQGALQYLAKAFSSTVDTEATDAGSTNSAITPKFISTSDKWHILKQIQEQSGTFQYPYLFLRMTSVEIPQGNDSYNPKALMRMGTYGSANDSLTTYNRHIIIPVNMMCEVSFLTNDFWQSMSFVNAWMFAALRKDMNFNVKYDGVAISIQVELDTNLATPEKDSTIDIPNNYEMLGTLKIKGYFSENKAIVDVEKYPIFRNIVIGPVLVSPGETIANTISRQQDLGLEPNYVEIPNDDPYLSTKTEKIILEIKTLDDSADSQ